MKVLVWRMRSTRGPKARSSALPSLRASHHSRDSPNASSNHCKRLLTSSIDCNHFSGLDEMRWQCISFIRSNLGMVRWSQNSVTSVTSLQYRIKPSRSCSTIFWAWAMSCTCFFSRTIVPKPSTFANKKSKHKTYTANGTMSIAMLHPLCIHVNWGSPMMNRTFRAINPSPTTMDIMMKQWPLLIMLIPQQQHEISHKLSSSSSPAQPHRHLHGPLQHRTHEQHFSSTSWRCASLKALRNSLTPASKLARPSQPQSTTVGAPLAVVPALRFRPPKMLRRLLRLLRLRACRPCTAKATSSRRRAIVLRSSRNLALVTTLAHPALTRFCAVRTRSSRPSHRSSAPSGSSSWGRPVGSIEASLYVRNHRRTTSLKVSTNSSSSSAGTCARIAAQCPRKWRKSRRLSTNARSAKTTLESQNL
mmetsp:Transcript_74919/g.217457  ORF Transcript_74919/g.217457 Transcript_74919/m.217457 type:complete len:418 (+) Transcript_74919:227-1480(+)